MYFALPCYIALIKVLLFSSPFCPSARMTKWYVPEPKKSSISLRQRRSTSCDHSDQAHLNINMISNGLSFIACELAPSESHLWSCNPVPLSPPVIPNMSHMINARLPALLSDWFKCGWLRRSGLIWTILLHGLSASSLFYRRSLWRLETAEGRGGEKLLDRYLILLHQINSLRFLCPSFSGLSLLLHKI